MEVGCSCSLLSKDGAVKPVQILPQRTKGNECTRGVDGDASLSSDRPKEAQKKKKKTFRNGYKAEHPTLRPHTSE